MLQFLLISQYRKRIHILFQKNSRCRLVYTINALKNISGGIYIYICIYIHMLCVYDTLPESIK